MHDVVDALEAGLLYRRLLIVVDDVLACLLGFEPPVELQERSAIQPMHSLIIILEFLNF